MKKRLFCTLIIALMMVLLTVTASATNIIASGYCGGEGDGKNLSWTLSADGTLAICGEGAMEDFTSKM